MPRITDVHPYQYQPRICVYCQGTIVIGIPHACKSSRQFEPVPTRECARCGYAVKSVEHQACCMDIG